MLKPPSFWKTINIISLILYPISILYSLASKLKYFIQTPVRLNSKIICIGNITLGGSGKTPLAIAIGQILLTHNYKIAYSCKNYGSSIKQPTQVTPSNNTKQVIDEALLLANIAPTFIAQERKKSLQMASKKADIIISDDGLQNNSFYKDLSILAIPKDTNFGNNLIFPAGPLRESLKPVLKRTNLVVMIDEIGNSHVQSRAIIEKHFDNKKIFKAIAKYKLPTSHKKKYIAFCGIAYPNNFFATLTKLGIKLVDKLSYPDHYNYTRKDLEKLLQQAIKFKVNLITTEKDFVRLNKNYQEKISYLKLNLEILNKQDFLKQLVVNQKLAQSL
ncbi:MAG: tetraacyldisaccharide 4'-kinase [Rickettsiales bacterium]|nr:tetraacyldisaccharide 4'-kinase [Rickettsiales bacterium]